MFILGVFFGYAHGVFGVGGNANSLLATVSIVSNLYQQESDDINVPSAVLNALSSMSTSVVTALTNELFASPAPSGPGTLAISGTVTFSADTMTIALPAAISDMLITGAVEITIPTSGTLAITVGGTPYTSSIPGLLVRSTAAANTFEINSPATVSGLLGQVNAHVTIDGALSVTAVSSEVYISVDSASTLNVIGNINFDGNNFGNTSSSNVGSIFNAGTIIASGNVTMSNNSGVLTLAGIENRGAIQSNTGNIIMG